MNNTPYQPPGVPPGTPPGMPPFQSFAPGKNSLLVTGILLIVFNAIGFFTTISTMATTDLWLWSFGGPAMRGTWMLIYTLNLLRSLFAVGVGIMAVTLCSRADKGGILLALGIVLLAATVIYSLVYNGFMISFGTTAALGFIGIIGIPFSLVIPILFIIGASKNKRAADAAAYSHHGQHRGY